MNRFLLHGHWHFFCRTMKKCAMDKWSPSRIIQPPSIHSEWLNSDQTRHVSRSISFQVSPADFLNHNLSLSLKFVDLRLRFVQFVRCALSVRSSPAKKQQNTFKNFQSDRKQYETPPNRKNIETRWVIGCFWQIWLKIGRAKQFAFKYHSHTN